MDSDMNDTDVRFSDENDEDEEDDILGNTELSPMVKMSRTRRAYHQVLRELKDAEASGTLSERQLSKLQRKVERKRYAYVGGLQGIVPPEMYQMAASFLEVRDRCMLSCCSKFFHDEVVFGGNSHVFVWNGSNDSDLLSACQLGATFPTLHYLVNGGADVNCYNPMDGVYGLQTPLIAAQARNHLETVKALLSLNADVDQATRWSGTALTEACRYGRTEIARVLLNAGANVHHFDRMGWTCLGSASYRGHLDIVELLLSSNVDVNEQDHRNRWNALHHAADKGYMNVVKRLLKENADVTLVDSNGHSALWWAREHNHDEVAQVLLDAGAPDEPHVPSYYH